MSRGEGERIPVIGWREWVSLPELGIGHIKAKVDTGARSSSLDAFDIDLDHRPEGIVARFKVRTRHRSAKGVLEVESPVLDIRSVRSSSGHAADRIVIVTPIRMMGQTWPIELTLANRGKMGFRMLLGREAVRGRMLVDPGRSYHGGRPARRKSLQGE